MVAALLLAEAIVAPALVELKRAVINERGAIVLGAAAATRATWATGLLVSAEGLRNRHHYGRQKDTHHMYRAKSWEKETGEQLVNIRHSWQLYVVRAC